jgi:hypothetical protein
MISRCSRLTLALLLLVVSAALAQTNFGRITGTVSDSSGAVIPGAKVTVVNEGTAAERVLATGQEGTYVATNLPVGIYSVRVTLPGFQPSARTGLNVVADARLTADVVLQPGTATETVNVIESAGEAVNTVSGEIARVVSTEQVQDLALNGRNYMQLVSLVPGTALLNEDQLALTTSLSTAEQSVNGNRGNSNNLQVDGGYNVDSGSLGSQINNVGIDFIREVNIKTSNFSAEYGRNSGAAINVITRSGSNQFHGSAFEFLRNDALDARSFFAPRKSKLRFNDFGWSLGGPVKRNRLFVFAGQEWKKIRQDAAPRLASMPTRAERAGDFSGRAGNLFSPGTTTPIANRNISSLITENGRAIANVFDRMEQLASSYTDTPTGNNTVFQFSSPFDWRQDLLRLDYNINDRHSIYGRYIHDQYDLVDPFPVTGLPTVPINRVRPGTSYQATHTWMISPTLTNEARGNAAWSAQRRNATGDTWLRDTYGFTFPQVFSGGPLENGIPVVNVQGFTSFSGPVFIILSPATDISFVDNLTAIKGAHTIKAGGIIIRNRKDQNGRADHAGNITFNAAGNSRTTGNAFADALLSNYRTYNEANDDPVGFFRFTQFEAYVQDNWRVNRRFSLEYGIRFQRGTPLYTQANNLTNFNPALYDPGTAVSITPAGLIVPGSGNRFNGLIRAGSGIPSDEVGRVPGANAEGVDVVPAGAPRGLYHAQSLFAPRFSFAWTPVGDKTAIRGGFGMFYDRPSGNILFASVNNPPYLRTVQFENGNLGNPTQGTPSALAPFGTLNVIDPNLEVPYTMNFSLSLQRELPRGVLVEGAYLGNLGRHLLRQPDINQAPFDVLTANAQLPSAQRLSVNALRPYRGYSAIRMRLSDSTSNYHALQLYSAKRKGDFLFTGSYTWSKVLTDASGEGDNPEDPFNKKFNYGPASFDRRHIFVASYIYELPFARKWSGVGRFLLGGWEVSGITRFQTGPYYTIIGNTSIGARRADYLGGPVSLPESERTTQRYFNTGVFAPAPDGRRGTGGVGIVPGPSMHVWDISLRKQFAATERVNIRFQADMFNLFNHANFRALNTDASNRDFGSISESGPGRNVQFGLKVQF